MEWVLYLGFVTYHISNIANINSLNSILRAHQKVLTVQYINDSLYFLTTDQKIQYLCFLFSTFLKISF